ncbi:hypothetical protein C8J57DRAFT_1504980 [Mycena rebaudengoi]|nr:hypothetical protein C8J57DRAFT_1504980 [Mycena rebaudengoi]
MRQPGPPSMLRQLAYQENSPLLGPDADPEGWQSLPSFSISGLLFSVLAVDVKCTLALAKPLCYTRSSSIPCALTIETENAQALDVLASPTAALVYLERHARSTTNAVSLEMLTLWYAAKLYFGLRQKARLRKRPYGASSWEKSI